ncbi:hypothetical protein [Pseudooceanicola marinus]|uniref:hypothetical protein n=1 Tax=Pseudooceanicola marinus TaxID=396013 RepID=UPI001C96F586|nr:hypothetical protein [Pseudooceanicola marinus]MBY5972185.1 hypothetical protein [Ferrimonas balearica]MCA1335289.1 hypothetical protein [Pseudooceanicola marinus]
MTAPDTNVETESRKHKAPIWGILLAVIFGLLMILAIVTTAFERSDEEAAPEAAVEGQP